MVLQHVGLSWIIQSNQKLNYDPQRHCNSWMINFPWYNTMICSRLHGLLYEYYVTTAIRERYSIMRSIEDHNKEKPTINYDTSSGGDIPLTYNSTKYLLFSFGLILNCIDSCTKSIKYNYLCQTTMYCK